MTKIAAVIFDLDGTITRPYLDFNQIRAEIGNVRGPLLEAMDKMTPPRTPAGRRNLTSPRTGRRQKFST
jgi:phosphoglycolate phosphatase-like HAD superfamily hydrolase